MKASNLLVRAFAAISFLCLTITAHSQVNTWVFKAHMSTPRAGAAASLGHDGRIYVFGGLAANGGAPLSSAEAYDPSTDSWSSIASMPIGLQLLAAVTAPDG